MTRLGSEFLKALRQWLLLFGIIAENPQDLF